MEFLTEDPTYLAGGLGLIAGAFLIALRVTQQGKYLVWAIAFLTLATLVVVVERVWVTDNERIEQVVYDLARAVGASDAEAALALMTPDVEYTMRGNTPKSGPEVHALVEQALGNTRFDFLRITRLRANAGGQSRRGTAEFKVLAGGSFQGRYSQLNFGSTNSSWSLGFRETSPGVWRVNRISPVSLPGRQNVIPLGGDPQPSRYFSPGRYGPRGGPPGFGPGRRPPGFGPGPRPPEFAPPEGPPRDRAPLDLPPGPPPPAPFP